MAVSRSRPRHLWSEQEPRSSSPVRRSSKASPRPRCEKLSRPAKQQGRLQVSGNRHQEEVSEIRACGLELYETSRSDPFWIVAPGFPWQWRLAYTFNNLTAKT